MIRLKMLPVISGQPMPNPQLLLIFKKEAAMSNPGQVVRRKTDTMYRFRFAARLWLSPKLPVTSFLNNHIQPNAEDAL